MTSAEAATTAAFQITVQPSGRAFSANAGEAILAAAIRSGVGLPYGCKDGACGSCKCKNSAAPCSTAPTNPRPSRPMKRPQAWC